MTGSSRAASQPADPASQLAAGRCSTWNNKKLTLPIFYCDAVGVELVLKVPVDYQESLVFRRLAEWFSREKPDVVRADFVFMSIYRDLAYLAREGRPAGRITAADRALIQRSLLPVVESAERADALFAELCGGIRYFVPDQDEFVCLIFAGNNAHFGQSNLSRERVGGFMRAHNKRVEREVSDRFQNYLQLPLDIFKIEGEPDPDAQTVQLARRIIVTCDSALGHKTRPDYHYNRALVQNAMRLAKKFTAEGVRDVGERILRNRGSAMLHQMNTEKLLSPGENGGLTIFEQISQG